MINIYDKVDETIDNINEFINNMKESATKPPSKPPSKPPKSSEKDYQYYAKIVNPETGQPYMIPMLNLDDPEYTNKYVDYMKVLENQPDLFRKILNWD